MKVKTLLNTCNCCVGERIVVKKKNGELYQVPCAQKFQYFGCNVFFWSIDRFGEDAGAILVIGVKGGE